MAKPRAKPKKRRRQPQAWTVLAPNRRGQLWVLRSGRGSADDLAARIPELTPLRTRAVLVVGLGSLGAPAAIELARNMVGQIRLLDGDFVDPGISVRWPIGYAYAGLMKVQAIAHFIHANYPNCTIGSTEARTIGLTRADDSLEPDPEILDRLLDGVDLVFDASAEEGVNHTMSELARERSIPYVGISATLGAWGGLVFRVRPDRGGCWVCLRHLQTTTGAPPHIGPAPWDPNGQAQPAGCASITFTGTSFDLAPVWTMGVRLAISTLCEGGAPGMYPVLPWDVGVVALRDPGGEPVPAIWTVYPLDKHPSCSRCRS